MKRLLAILMAITMMLSLSVTAFAAEEPTLYVAGVAVTSDNLEINSADNGAITGSATYDPDTNTLTLDNFSYTGEGYEYDPSWYSAAIYFNPADENTELTIELVGTNTVIIDNSECTSEAICIANGNLIIEGNGSLSATGDTGIYAWGNISISGENTSVIATGTYGIQTDGGDIDIDGGKVEANGFADGIVAYGNISISSGEVRATATYEYGTGIYADGNIDIDDGKVEANGGYQGIYSCGNITIDSGTVKATASGDYGIGIVADAVTVNGGTVEVISTGEYGYGTATYDGVSCNGDFDVYAGEAAPGELVTSPTTSTYNSKYVKIVPAEPEVETKSTTVTYEVAPTYTVTIPATVALGETATIKAENVVVAKGKQVEVTLTDANGFTVATPQGAELGYTVKNGETTVNEGDTVLTVNPDNGKTGETTLKFVAPETAQFAGDYTGTVAFTIAVKDVPLINFTLDMIGIAEWVPGLTANLQAEPGMTWGEWVESAYNVDGYIVYPLHWVDVDVVGPTEHWAISIDRETYAYVSLTDEIIAGYEYCFSITGG